LAALLLLALAGCAQSGAPALPAAPQAAASSAELDAGSLRRVPDRSGPIQHIVVVIQENRTVDNLFNGLAGADTASSGRNSRGQTINLRPVPLTAPYDILHTHSAYQTEYRDGRMDGFDRVATKCEKLRQNCPPPRLRAYGYVPHDEIGPYLTLAARYTFADEMFESNEGPSFPAHQYLVSGTSAITNASPLRASENPRAPNRRQTGGCDAPPGTIGALIGPNGEENTYAFPCFDRVALPDLVDGHGLTWHYYQERSGSGLWNGLDAIEHIWNDRAEYKANVVAPSSQFLRDVRGGYLANVTWITPSANASDHAGSTDGSGPSWVASIVGAVGSQSYWNSTVIVVVWDDWGGWYDHVAPKRRNSYELGMRVPMLVISPYAKRGYVSHVHYEFGSILKFIEETFNLGSMKTTDAQANDLRDCFNFGAPPRPYEPLQAKYSPQYFLSQPPANASPDDD
jgi:phospholipase C